MNHTSFARAGWRAVVALIKPAPGYRDISDFHRMAPDGVAISATVLHKPLTQTTAEQLAELGNHVVDAAKVVVQSSPSVIVWNCTTGSLIKGFGYDQELRKRIEDATGTPATTTSTSVIAALKKLGVKKLSIATPYIDEVNIIEKKFFEDNGFEVLTLKGLLIQEAQGIDKVPPDEMFRFAKGVDVPEAECMFVSCTGLETATIIQPLEYDLGKPVVTSNQAAFWNALQIVKVREPIEGYGRLMREP